MWLTRLLVLVAATEATSYALLLMWQPFTYTHFDQLRSIRVQQGLRLRSELFARGAPTTMTVPHPFLGFTNDPAYDPAQVTAEYGLPTSAWGFVDDKSPIQEASPDRVIVGLFGGSVALRNSIAGLEDLREGLSAIERFRGKTLVFVRAAQSGYKQPQQLMTLNYLLALGAHFDVVINLDGFNDVTLPVTNNVPDGYFPFFPREWPSMLGSVGGPDRSRLVGAITYLSAERSRLAEIFSQPLVRWSVTANLAWALLDRKLAGEFDSLQLQFAALGSDTATQPYAAIGPPHPYSTREAMYRDLVDLWVRSSVQMRSVCKGQGIYYFHFLQPNQYVEGSKPFGAEETKLAVRMESPYASGAREGYPWLIKAGQSLLTQGVDFTDLTQIFADVKEPRYSDSCCHLTADGYKQLSRRIALHIRSAIDGSRFGE